MKRILIKNAVIVNEGRKVPGSVVIEGEKIAEIFKKYEDKMKDEVLADEIIFESTNGYVKEWNINGETVTMGVENNHK